MSEKVGEAFYELIIRDVNFQQSLKAQERRTSEVSSRINKMLKFQASQQVSGGGISGGISGGMGGMGGMGSLIGGGLALGGIALAANQMSGMVSSAFAYNAAIEKSTVSLGVLLGSESRAVSLMKDLQTFAAKTPFELPTLNQATVSLLATKKVAQSQVMPILKKLGDAAAGSSEGFASMPRITRAVAQMLTKGKIQAEEMMQLSEAGVPAWAALAKKMGKSTAEVQKLGEKGKLGIREIMMLVDGLGDTYEGLAEKQSQTFEGLSSTIKDNLGKAFGDAFKPLYDFSTRSMKKLVKFMDSPAFTKSIEIFASGLQSTIVIFEKLINHPLAKLIAKISAVSAGVIAVEGAFSLVGTAISAAFSLAPVVAFGAAVGYVGSLFYEAFSGDAGQELVGLLRESYGLVKEIIFFLSQDSAVRGVTGALIGASQVMGEMFGPNGMIQLGFNRFLKNTLSGIKSILDVVSALSSNTKMAWTYFQTSADKALALVASYFNDRFVYLIGTQIPYVIAGMFDGMLASGAVLVSNLKNLFVAMFESVGMLLNGIIDAQIAKVDGIIAGMNAIKSGNLKGAMHELSKGFAKSEEVSKKSKEDSKKAFEGKTSGVMNKSFDEFLSAFQKRAKTIPEFKSSKTTDGLFAAIQSQFAGLLSLRKKLRNESFSTMSGIEGALAGIKNAGSNLGGVMTDVFGQAGMKAAEAKPIADVIDQGKKILDFFAPQEQEKKEVKTEFVGLTEMNKRIQSQLGKAKENADRRRLLLLNEEQNRGIDEVVKKGEATVGVLKDIASKLGLK